VEVEGETEEPRMGAFFALGDLGDLEAFFLGDFLGDSLAFFGEDGALGFGALLGLATFLGALFLAVVAVVEVLADLVEFLDSRGLVVLTDEEEEEVEVVEGFLVVEGFFFFFLGEEGAVLVAVEVVDEEELDFLFLFLSFLSDGPSLYEALTLVNEVSRPRCSDCLICLRAVSKSIL